MMLSSVWYRAGQFRRAIGARPAPADLAEVRRRLTAGQWDLFGGMSQRDQWHSIETLRLLGASWADPDLELAALLHDSGKGYVRLHERVLYVLLSAAPPLLSRLASPHRGRLRATLHRSLHHAETGAELVLQTGAGERTAHLIRTHHHPDLADPIALALLHADARA
jgi:HD domain